MEFLTAFLIGGLICVIGQVLIDATNITPARILVIFVVLGVALEALGIYQPLVDFAGCGATVPLTGFGYTLAKGTEEMIGEQGWLGILTGPFSAGAAGIAVGAVILTVLASNGIIEIILAMAVVPAVNRALRPVLERMGLRNE